MFFFLLAVTFPAWRPHFSFLENPLSNEMMVLRWLHLIFGIIWIGLLYFFNLVLTPAMKKCEPQLRVKIYPEVMPGAMGWFRWSALATWLLGVGLLSQTPGRLVSAFTLGLTSTTSALVAISPTGAKSLRGS